MWIFRSNGNKKKQDSDDVLEESEKTTELVRLWKEFRISKTSERFQESFEVATEKSVSSMVDTLGEEDRTLLVDVLLDIVESQSNDISNVFLALGLASKSNSSLWNEKRLSRLLKLLRDSETLERKQSALHFLFTLSSDESIKTRMAGLEEIRYIADILEVKDETLRSNSLKSLRKLLKIHELNEEEREHEKNKSEEERFRGFAPWLGKWLNARRAAAAKTTQKVDEIRKKRPFPPPRHVLDAYQKRLRQSEREEESDTLTAESISSYKNQTISAVIAMLTHGTQKDFLGALRAVRIFLTTHIFL